VALELGVPAGGWCPEGRAAEDGPLPERYPLEELPGAGYRQRTRQNVIDSDGTLIVHFGSPSGGTAQTIADCIEQERPFLLIDAGELDIERASGMVRRFLRRHSIAVLNVAGPRASGEPRAYPVARELLLRVLAGGGGEPGGEASAAARPGQRGAGGGDRRMEIELRPFDAGAEYYFREGCFITELSNTDNDRDVSIARVRLEPGKATRWHCLEGIAERYVILAGTGRVEVGGDLSRPVAVGDVVVIPPATRQRIFNAGCEDLLFLAICSPRFRESAYRDLEARR
jgi:mannose-6-phosphate isomerase-like protein (cupin superfamily)